MAHLIALDPKVILDGVDVSNKIHKAVIICEVGNLKIVELHILCESVELNDEGMSIKSVDSE